MGDDRKNDAGSVVYVRPGMKNHRPGPYRFHIKTGGSYFSTKPALRLEALHYGCEIGKNRFGAERVRQAAAVQNVRLVMQ